ncbi:MAG: hypothetical protein KDK78_10905, partial [Chlamydiia bacterium]|nr:hypothetical protein [Chlamydiia bacterium]
MTQEPAFLSTYGDLAKTVLAQGGVRDLDFSRRTYQVAVQAPKDREAFWVFMQFSKQGELADSFCSCKSYDDTHSCIHLPAAYLKVKQHNRLLNERFEESFWTCICRSYYQHYPKDKHVGIADDGYHWGSFHLQPKEKKKKK